MVFDESTGLKVLDIFKTKGYNSVSYCGCWSSDSITFEVAYKESGEIKAGFMVTVNEQFKVQSLRRLGGLVIRNIYGGEKNHGMKKVYDRFNYPLVYVN